MTIWRKHSLNIGTYAEESTYRYIRKLHKLVGNRHGKLFLIQLRKNCRSNIKTQQERIENYLKKKFTQRKNLCRRAYLQTRSHCRKKYFSKI